jgi:hypothetical protein
MTPEHPIKQLLIDTRAHWGLRQYSFSRPRSLMENHQLWNHCPRC